MSASPAFAAWAKFPVAQFPGRALRPTVVRLNDGPALLLDETGGRIHVLRRRGGNWEQDSFTLPVTRGGVFVACADRGDGVRRLYFTMGMSSSIWEVTPYGKDWGVLEFSPAPDGPPRQGIANLGQLAAGVSVRDGRPRLFVHRPAREDILECAWKEGRWRCEKILGGDTYPSALRFAPASWDAGDVLLKDGMLAARKGQGWEVVGRVSGFNGLHLSKKVPRAIYTFDQSVFRTTFDRNLGVAANLPLPAAPDAFYGETVGVMPFEANERLFMVGWDGNIHEYREEASAWRTGVVAAFPGKAYAVTADDARGDGFERVYVLESDIPGYSSAPSFLWEMSFYEEVTALLVPNPVIAGRDDPGMLGDLFRAELARYDHLTVIHEGSAEAASDEESLFQLLCQGDECDRMSRQPKRPDFEVRASVSESKASIELQATVRRLSPGAKARVVKHTAAPGADLSMEIRLLAARLAEEWPFR